MQIVIRQSFPLGRFHATPWKIFPYDDPHGEWPPSPWRLLRGIIARSYQFEREQGSLTRDQRTALVTAFCQSDISWRLPEMNWRGPGLRQYQPVEFGFDNPPVKKLKLIPLDGELLLALGGSYAILGKTDAGRLSFEVFDAARQSLRAFEPEDEQLVRAFRELTRRELKREKTSLRGSGHIPLVRRYAPRSRNYTTTKVQDNFWLVPPGSDLADASSALWWFLSGDSWTQESLDILEACLVRMTYFGRAESIPEISVVRPGASDHLAPNCYLSAIRSGGMAPVLAPMTDASLEQVEATTDSYAVAEATIPPGSRWLYAKRPESPQSTQVHAPIRKLNPTQLVQFAIGTRVTPAMRDTVRLTQRFRGRTLRNYLNFATNGACFDWRDTPHELRARASWLTGKDAEGHPLTEHEHATFFIHAEDGRPVRLCVWRNKPFDDIEQNAILGAAEEPLPVGFKGDPWTVTLIPLDSLVPPPPALSSVPCVSWDTVSPFVPPRHVYGDRGRVKPGESVESQVCRELENRGIDSRGVQVSVEQFGWVSVHESRQENERRTNCDKLGYNVRLMFPTPTLGPLFLGASSHFGLGVLAPRSRL